MHLSFYVGSLKKINTRCERRDKVTYQVTIMMIFILIMSIIIIIIIIIIIVVLASVFKQRRQRESPK